MPPTIPSHQGFVAPLWRRWPGVFDAPALFIGAAMPDVVDGVLGVFQGELGHGIGHSLVAVPLLCVPAGFFLWWTFRALSRSMSPRRQQGFWSRAWNSGLAALHAPPPGSGWRRWLLLALSLAVGAFSHLIIDLISHGNFALLYPWFVDVDVFPAWWHHAWTHISVPFYRMYPVGPHGVMWVLLGVLGAYLLLYPLFHTDAHTVPEGNEEP